MNLSPFRGWLAIVAGVFAPAAFAQPPKDKGPPKLAPAFTAFPDLKPRPAPSEEDLRKDGAKAREKQEAAMREILFGGFPADLPRDPTPLQRVRHAQVREGLTYLARVWEVIAIGRWDPAYFGQYVTLGAEVYRAAAEVETTAAGRVRCYEVRVIFLKASEEFIASRVQFGTDPPQRRDEIAFRRLQAEADLLRVKAEVGEVGRVPDRSGTVFVAGLAGKPGGAKAQPAFTAFPDVKPPPGPWDGEPSKDDRMEALRKYEAALHDILFRGFPADLPVYPTPLQKVRHEQVLEGLAYLARVREVIQIGRWDSQYLADYLDFGAEVYRAVAELESTHAGRVRCYEVRLILMKDIERFIALRIQIGTDPSQNVNTVAFRRLQAEADLLAVKAAAGNGGMMCPPNPAAPSGQPLNPDPAYTAFPDVKPPAFPALEGKSGPEIQQLSEEHSRQVLALSLKHLTHELPGNPTLLQKVRDAQLQHGTLYIRQVGEVIGIGRWDPAYSMQYGRTTAEVHRVAADAEMTVAERLDHFKTRVAFLKEMERFVGIRVQIGTEPPQNRNAARFTRLQMEAVLLEELGPLPVIWPGVGGVPAACCPAPGGRFRRHR